MPPAKENTKRRPRATEADLQLAVSDQDARVAEEDRAQPEEAGVVKAPLKGKLFRIDTDAGLMPLMEWAAANDSKDPEMSPQLAALFNLLKDVVHPDDWDAFRKHATAVKAKGEDFVKFQEAAAEAIAARPTGESGTSSDGS